MVSLLWLVICRCDEYFFYILFNHYSGLMFWFGENDFVFLNHINNLLENEKD